MSKPQPPTVPPPRFPPPGVVPRLDLPDRGYPHKESVLSHVIGRLYKDNKIDDQWISKLVIDEICRFISGGAALYRVNDCLYDAKLAKTPRRSNEESFATLLSSRNVSPPELLRIGEAIEKCQFLVRPFSMTEITTTYRYIPIFDEEQTILGVLVLCVKDSSVLNLFHEKMWNDEDIGNIKDLMISSLKYSTIPETCTPELSCSSITASHSLDVPKVSILEHLSIINKHSTHPSALLHISAIEHLLGVSVPKRSSHLDIPYIRDELLKYVMSVSVDIPPERTYVIDTSLILTTILRVLYIVGIEDVFVSISVLDSIDTSTVFTSRRVSLKDRIEDLLRKKERHTLTINIEHASSPYIDEIKAIHPGISSFHTNTHIRFELTSPSHNLSHQLLDIHNTKKGIVKEYKIAMMLKEKIMKKKHYRCFRGKRIIIVCKNPSTSSLLTEVLCLWGCIPSVVKSSNDIYTDIYDKMNIDPPFSAIVNIRDCGMVSYNNPNVRIIEIKTRQSSYVSIRHLFVKLYITLR